ncbi:MAG: C-type lectin domain-containing protein [Polyangiales bacterium]
MFVQVDRRGACLLLAGSMVGCRVYDRTLVDSPALTQVAGTNAPFDALGSPIEPAPPSPAPAAWAEEDADAGLIAPARRAIDGSTPFDSEVDAGPRAGAGAAGSGGVAPTSAGRFAGAAAGAQAAAGVGGSAPTRPKPEQSRRCAGRLGYVSPVSGQCYFALMEAVSWNVARDFCLQADARLASIVDASEQQFVATVLEGPPLWIGLSRFGSVSFTWLDGAPLTYAAWAEGAPSARGDRGVVIPGTGEWVDVDVHELFRPLCSR